MQDKATQTWRTITSEPFIAATGFAAFVHSSWTLTLLFSGRIPGLREPVAWALAVVPAMALAFAIDVGQIRTAYDIRNGQRSFGKVGAFIVLAFATYYLQWVFMALHIPAMSLGAGVREEWIEGVALMRDAAVFIVPAMLPLATMLYTVSNSAPSEAHERITWRWRFWQSEQQPLIISQPPRIKALQNGASAGIVKRNADGEWDATCKLCSDFASTRPTERGARSAYSAHSRKHQEPTGANE